MEHARWLEIEGYQQYSVSNDGRIFSKISKKILSPSVSPRGYAIIKLGSKKAFLVHRLVAKAFIPNVWNKPHVNHIDGNQLNNHVDNLEWVTQSENQLHAVKMGLQPKRVWSEESRKKLSASLMGHQCSLATRERISASKKGKSCKPFTAEHKRRISESLKRRH